MKTKQTAKAPPTPGERVMSILQTGGMFSFKELAEKSGLSKPELEQTICALRMKHRNIRFLKFSKQYQLDKTPTPYFQLHNFSTVLPLEGAIGLISDTHLGSIAERLDILDFAYDTFKAAGVAQVFHTGDITDGEGVYPGHNNHVHCRGDDQLAWCAAKYPWRSGIITNFIAGN